VCAYWGGALHARSVSRTFVLGEGGRGLPILIEHEGSGFGGGGVSGGDHCGPRGTVPSPRLIRLWGKQYAFGSGRRKGKAVVLA